MRYLRSIHQIEVTSRCNLACVYCVHPKMPRPKLDMSWETFTRAVKWIEHFGLGADGEINLSGIGEPTLHPALATMVRDIRRRFPKALIVIPTNGLLLDETLARDLAMAGDGHLGLFVSMHIPLRAAPAVALAKRFGILAGAALDPISSPNDWAGQVDWIKADYSGPCQWLHNAQGFVAADGRIFTCCLDSTGESTIGHVDNDPAPVPMGEWSLCKNCCWMPP